MRLDQRPFTGGGFLRAGRFFAPDDFVADNFFAGIPSFALSPVSMQCEPGDPEKGKARRAEITR
jgi:hypothetical protein